MSNKKRSTKKDGPYLAAALFCDQLVEGKDGAISVTRMMDQMQLVIAGTPPPDFPSEANPISVSINGLLAFKNGYAPYKEQREISVVMESPSGKRGPVVKQKMAFTKLPQGGGNLIMRSVIQVYKGGLFWFDVYLDGKHMVRMPLQITIQRQEVEPTPQLVSPPSPNGNKKPRRKRRS